MHDVTAPTGGALQRSERLFREVSRTALGLALAGFAWRWLGNIPGWLDAMVWPLLGISVGAIHFRDEIARQRNPSRRWLWWTRAVVSVGVLLYGVLSMWMLVGDRNPDLFLHRLATGGGVLLALASLALIVDAARLRRWHVPWKEAATLAGGGIGMLLCVVGGLTGVMLLFPLGAILMIVAMVAYFSIRHRLSPFDAPVPAAPATPVERPAPDREI